MVDRISPGFKPIFREEDPLWKGSLSCAKCTYKACWDGLTSFVIHIDYSTSTSVKDKKSFEPFRAFKTVDYFCDVAAPPPSSSRSSNIFTQHPSMLTKSLLFLGTFASAFRLGPDAPEEGCRLKCPRHSSRQECRAAIGRKDRT